MGHDVPDSGRAEIHAGIMGQCTGTHRLTILDIALYQHFQKMLGAFVDAALVNSSSSWHNTPQTKIYSMLTQHPCS
jgi:hypothetical protein